MKKKYLVMAATAAALTMATGITAFAGSWKSDTWGYYYENDDGTRPVYSGWFTDPADGSVYYMDPDGYMMAGTTVEGFRLGDDGRKIEKTEEDIAKENERKAYLASRPSPSKKVAAADLAAAAAKTGTASTGTTRTTYLAEMTAFMDKIFMATAEKRTDTTIKTYSSANTISLQYAFSNPDGYQFIKSSLWKVAKSTAADYHENTAELSYHYDAVGDPDRDIYIAAFQDLVIAALGDTEGKNVIDTINTERAAENNSFTRSGLTDVGNSYTLVYNNNLATIKVVCSEIVPQTETENTDSDAETESTSDTEATTESSNASTSVIVAGQSTASTESETAEEANSDASDDSETAASAEETVEA